MNISSHTCALDQPTHRQKFRFHFVEVRGLAGQLVAVFEPAAELELVGSRSSFGTLVDTYSCFMITLISVTLLYHHIGLSSAT